MTAFTNIAGRYRFILLGAAALACARDPGPTAPPPPQPSPVADVRLTEIDYPALPSPYYQFAYDAAGELVSASFASSLVTYAVEYAGNRISELKTVGLLRARLLYAYDASGKVKTITYRNSEGTDYVRVSLTYAGDRLTLLERERLVDGAFQPDKRMAFVYDADGNLAELTDERLPFPGQTAATFVDRFAQYDGGINVDGFSLIHNEFFDHLVLLPGVRLQHGNPAMVTRSGDGDNYEVHYTYTYDGMNRPLARHGDVLLLTGPNAGRHFQDNATYAYE